MSKLPATFVEVAANIVYHILLKNCNSECDFLFLFFLIKQTRSYAATGFLNMVVTTFQLVSVTPVFLLSANNVAPVFQG